jgi:dienelactone hydrolase
MDTTAERWAMLEPHTQHVGPDDDRARPAVLLFHGCGGLRAHLPLYAEAAKAAGVRAFIIDSFGARGWSRAFALATVCTGVRLRGWARAGDVMAAIQGLSQRPDVDGSRLGLAGWSHGGWAIMEALSAPREMAGEMLLRDPAAAELSGVRAVFLAYPYVGVAATGRFRAWRHCPKTLAVIAARDHLTTVRNAERVLDVACGNVEIERWTVDGTHAFDEPTGAGPMRHDQALTDEALKRFAGFLGEALGAEV